MRRLFQPKVHLGFIGLLAMALLSPYGADAKVQDKAVALCGMLAGTWHSTAGDGHQERWDLLSAGHLKGFAASAKMDAGKITEYLEIAIVDGTLHYIAEVIGQNDGKAIHFTLNSAEASDTFFPFENPDHDFPTRIAYHFLEGGMLEVSISGKDKTTTLHMKRATDSSAAIYDMPERYTQYNLWANAAMTQWLSTASEEDMTREISSSFSSLRQTVLHIWSAEYLWLQVLKDEPYEDNPTKNFEGSNAELLGAWMQASENFQAYVRSLGPDALAGTRGSGSERPPLAVTDIVQHCMNHSTYHRGQLITMGRQAGLGKPPQTDFIFFVRQEQEKSE